MTKQKYAFGYTDPVRMYIDPQYDDEQIKSTISFYKRYEEIIVGLLCLVGFISIVFVFIWFLSLFAPSEEQINNMHNMQVIQEFDGCKVYRFWDVNYHYVTKCGNHTATERHYSEYCGKACTKQKVERIEND
jgi:hypothetical protein